MIASVFGFVSVGRCIYFLHREIEMNAARTHLRAFFPNIFYDSLVMQYTSCYQIIKLDRVYHL